MATARARKTMTTKPTRKIKVVPDIQDTPTPVRRFGEQTMALVGNLHVDHSYQRELNMARAQRIADNFDPYLFGELVVVQRSDGSRSVPDGQHRLEALKIMGWDDQKVPALLYEGLTDVEEAKLFHDLNHNRTRPTPLDLFRARMVQQEPQAVHIYKSLERHGVHIHIYLNPTGSSAGGGGFVNCISRLDEAYRYLGPDGLDRMIGVFVNAWGSKNTSVSSALVGGGTRFFCRFGFDVVDVKHFSKGLSKVTPGDIYIQAKSLQGLGGRAMVTSAIALVMLSKYNSRLSSGRLPDTTMSQFEKVQVSWSAVKRSRADDGTFS